jgi:hypothetical protein
VNKRPTKINGSSAGAEPIQLNPNALNKKKVKKYFHKLLK